MVSDGLAARFKAIYEIDRAGEAYIHPNFGIHLDGLRRFQGSSYASVYNGTAGYPGRQTEAQPVRGWQTGAPGGPQVSWRDSCLPAFIPETSCNLSDVPPTP